MSAERLREAAKVLRERAEAATPGPWRAMEYDASPGDEGVALLGAASTPTGERMIGYFHVLSQQEQEANGDYARTMHPDVGLALADWLDDAAANADFMQAVIDAGRAANPNAFLKRTKADDVADLILGGTP